MLAIPSISIKTAVSHLKNLNPYGKDRWLGDHQKTAKPPVIPSQTDCQFF